VRTALPGRWRARATRPSYRASNCRIGAAFRRTSRDVRRHPDQHLAVARLRRGELLVAGRAAQRVQASAQAAVIGDDRVSEASRAARLDARTHPVIAQGGPQIFGDPDARFTDLVSLIIDTAARLRADASM
jgi:hypothetical protein